jgi:Zinc knuckle
MDDPTGWANRYIELLESYDPDLTVESIRHRFCPAIPPEIAQHLESYLVTAGLQGRELSVADYISFFEDEAGFLKDRQRASELRRAENYSRSQPRDLPRISQSNDRSRPQSQFAGDKTSHSTRGRPGNNGMRSVSLQPGNTMKCHNCQKIGHLARDCPHPRVQAIEVEDANGNTDEQEP